MGARRLRGALAAILLVALYIDPSVRPRIQDLATFQEFFHRMGWVKQTVPMERVAFLE